MTRWRVPPTFRVCISETRIPHVIVCNLQLQPRDSLNFHSQSETSVSDTPWTFLKSHFLPFVLFTQRFLRRKQVIVDVNSYSRAKNPRVIEMGKNAFRYTVAFDTEDGSDKVCTAYLINTCSERVIICTVNIGRLQSESGLCISLVACLILWINSTDYETLFYLKRLR